MIQDGIELTTKFIVNYSNDLHFIYFFGFQRLGIWILGHYKIIYRIRNQLNTVSRVDLNFLFNFSFFGRCVFQMKVKQTDTQIRGSWSEKWTRHLTYNYSYNYIGALGRLPQQKKKWCRYQTQELLAVTASTDSTLAALLAMYEVALK